ncbi:probable glucan 1,3-beta-glucosidase A isoform X2 [Triticum dicoccoides]|uniref:probable glucan 1,3-beta-glucosidase A isoform X2 n=1 Tax=Triticum dicoccoides TaxID=85692 RepID=UPI00162D55A1|nr:probable glucan 1,3-beta-glucosidase A isoform X2 [Triticum dicoccoides]
MGLPHAGVLIFGLLSVFQLSHSSSDKDDFTKVRAVNLGGWLVVEGWIKPSLFDGIPNGDMLDGVQVQLKSVALQKYVSAVGGGGGNVAVDQDAASTWETFKLWRVSDSEFQFRCLNGQFLTASNQDVISATTDSPGDSETFYIERNNSMLHIKLSNGSYLQVTNNNQLTSNYHSQPGWGDDMATFQMTIAANNLHGDYQLANGYGPVQAKAVLTEHRKSFVTGNDFFLLSQNSINAVRIPVGWWIAYDPDPPAPFIGGSLEYLDRAFYWAQVYGLKCIIDLHAAPGSQNGMEHSASRDGSVDWPSEVNIQKTLDVIKFLAQRYADDPSLLGIELLNEPSAGAVPLDTLVSYYKKGYKIVRSYSETAYVIFCQRIGNADPMELYEADLGPTNTVVDLHYYNLFDPYYEKLNATENIQFVYEKRLPQVRALNGANGPLVFVGEWVNEWNVANASQIQYRSFGKAQLEVFGEASFGWSYWTVRCNSVHWDYEWNVRNRYLIIGGSPLQRASYTMLVAGCLMYLLLLTLIQ